VPARDAPAMALRVSLVLATIVTLAAATAFAEPVRIDLAGEIASSSLPNSSPGDPFSISLFVDAQAPDENGAPGAYLATTPGTGQFQWKDATPGTMELLSVSSNASSGEWVAELWTDPIAGSHPVTVSLSGLGMSPDQVLPDFTSFTNGTAFFDGSLTWFSFVIYVDVLSVEIVSLEEPPSVPALPAGSGLLVYLLIVIASARSARRAR
jgi:hypothetical protein